MMGLASPQSTAQRRRKEEANMKLATFVAILAVLAPLIAGC